MGVHSLGERGCKRQRFRTYGTRTDTLIERLLHFWGSYIADHAERHFQDKSH